MWCTLTGPHSVAMYPYSGQSWKVVYIWNPGATPAASVMRVTLTRLERASYGNGWRLPQNTASLVYPGRWSSIYCQKKKKKRKNNNFKSYL